MKNRSFDVTIVGSGFAGSLLARILASSGWRVLLVERGTHPRFAIGESSTPLANLALERMGRRYEFPELVALATHGRWIESYPQIHRGLKRGFSFYRHEVGEPFVPLPDNENRLLVAASPDDDVADTHWLRADVDRLFFDLARLAGVEAVEDVELDGIAPIGGGFRLSGSRGTERLEVETALVVDASGEGGFLRRQLPLERGAPLRTASTLLFGHFVGVPCLEEVCGAAEADWSAPYPEDWAAVHHLLDEGWMYLLRFDSGLVSGGMLFAGTTGDRVTADPEQRWGELLGRYPTLQALFAEARQERPVAWGGPVQRRLSRAHGPGWVVLPHTYGFVDPLYSTGIAWSLLGVERLADTLASLAPDHPSLATGSAFDRYAHLLGGELEQIDRLVSAAYAARADFDLFAAHSMLYFALVSFEEATQRLGDDPAPWWRGFLGCGEPRGSILEEAEERAAAVVAGRQDSGAYRRWVRTAIEPFNIAGLAEPARRNLYPVDLDDLVEAAPKLGRSADEVRAALPALRGDIGA